MREVTTAKSAGFCFGVRRAVDMVYAEAKKDNRVFTLGPIIHNEQVVKDLEKKGYRFAGKNVHAGNKICHWTRKSIVDEGTCYKEQFYGIKSHRFC